MKRTILHCDLNNFYASVEAVLNPALAGKAIAVCGDPEKRHGIVLAKSNIAKSFGVSTGEAIWQARQKCPDLILVRPHYELYVKYSKKVRAIYEEYSDRVESFGIDECWLDVTGSTALFGSGEVIANTIRERVKHETGLTISVGVSFTKTFAKLGSDMKKPDAVTVIPFNRFKEIVWPLDVGELLMIGHRTVKKLNALNIHTIGELAQSNRELLRQHFGIIGDKIIDSAAGLDTEEVKLISDKRLPKSVGHGTTTTKDILNLNQAKIVIYALSEMVATRLRRYGLLASCVSIGVKDNKFNGFTRNLTLPNPTSNAESIAKAALELLKQSYDFSVPVRAITVYTSKLSPIDDCIQLSFFDDNNEKINRLSASVDKIREKYGYHSVERAILLKNDVLGPDLHDEDDFKPFQRD